MLSGLLAWLNRASKLESGFYWIIHPCDDPNLTIAELDVEQNKASIVGFDWSFAVKDVTVVSRRLKPPLHLPASTLNEP